MTLAQFLTIVQLVFFAAEFVAGGISVHYGKGMLKAISSVEDWTDAAAWAAAKALSDLYHEKQKLSMRWMYALLGVVILLACIIGALNALSLSEG